MRCLTFVLSIAIVACNEQEFTWAFAQNTDGTFKESEFCRESLAQSLYAEANRERTVRQGSSNVFAFNGAAESYRIYAFKSQSECETALTNIQLRQTLK
jgi:hypothetical protein